MIGYNEKAEHEAVVKAAEAFAQALEQTEGSDLPSRLLRVSDRDLDRLSNLVRHLETLPYDHWTQRPFDLLTHDGEGQTREELFRLCQSWELLSIFRTCGGDRAGLEKAVRKYIDTTLRERTGYDIYDHQISYPERMARHRGKKLPDCGEIVLPHSLCTANMTDARIDLAVFAAMLYRHLKGLGLTAEDLEKTDFWIQPGGVRGLGIYLDNPYTAATFFSHIEHLTAHMTDRPVRLISANDVRMAAMSPSMFRAFETAEAAGTPEPHTVHPSGVVIDGLGNLHVSDDGTQAPARAICDYLRSLAAPSEDPLAVLWSTRKDSCDLWKQMVADNHFAAWESPMLEHLENRRAKIDLRLYKNARQDAEKNIQRALPLLCGYLLYQKSNRRFEGSAEDFWAAFSETVRQDPDGIAFAAYRQSLLEKKHLTIFNRHAESTFTLSLEEAVSVPRDAETMADLDRVLTKHGPIVDCAVLHRLFDAAAAQLRGMKIGSTAKLLLETALDRDKTPGESLKTFLLLTLQWQNDAEFTFTEPENPFHTPADSADFRAFLDGLDRIHRALHITRTSEGSFRGHFHNVFPKLDGEEERFLAALTIEPKEKITRAAYDARLDGLEIGTLNGLIAKALPFMEGSLPQEFAEYKLLHKTKEIRKQLGGLLLLVLLYALENGEYRPDFAGQTQIPLDHRLQDLQGFRDFLLDLVDLHVGKSRKKYTVHALWQDGCYTVRVSVKEKQKETRKLDR